MVVFISFYSLFPLQKSLDRTILTEYLFLMGEMNDRIILYSNTRVPKILIPSLYLFYTWAWALLWLQHQGKSLFLSSVPNNKSHSAISPILKDFQKEFLKKDQYCSGFVLCQYN